MRFLSRLWPALLLAFACNAVPQKASQEPDFSAYLALPLAERQAAEHATGAFAIAPDLSVDLFASEPLLTNPTNLAIDARGRVWVLESPNYAVVPEEQTQPGGRISILSDTDGDGQADTRHTYYEGEDVDIALGISVLGNKVYVSRSPHLLVFTDENDDDVPDRKEILFTGMGNPGDHSTHALVFGPDGRYYFNHGNAVRQILSGEGEPLTSKHGYPVKADGKPFHGGLVYRFEAEGKNLEILGHNFRNNYEVAVDSYGTLWQSDNDDDGNRGVRINYVMEYGNYGYRDEMTGAHWSQYRTGWHDSIPLRHWHQNDPGSIPNLVYTGAGSPAGITVYEGEMLPERFWGAPIHADAGPNLVRAYPSTRDQAGYTATIEPIFQSEHDQWSRPIDVAVAPDGSLLAADWYDPVVGGYAAGDHVKGRIFRVTPQGKLPYTVPDYDLSQLDQAAAALQSPNEDLRFQAWQALAAVGEAAKPALEPLWKQAQPHLQARALWLLGRLPESGAAFRAEALQHDKPDLRIVALRLTRQLNAKVLAVAEQLAEDPSPAVRREVALALRHQSGSAVPAIWTTLAQQYDGQDRWYLEALGIGAEGKWDACLAAWQAAVGEDWDSKAGRDIVWRARSERALPLLAELIRDPQTGESERLRYFRAFDFQPEDEAKTEALLSLLEVEGHPALAEIRALALHHLDPAQVKMTPRLQAALEASLQTTAGTPRFVQLIDRYDLTGKGPALLALTLAQPDEEAGMQALRLLLNEDFGGAKLLREPLAKAEAAETLVPLLGAANHPEARALLETVAFDQSRPEALRKKAVIAIGQGWGGENYLLELVKKPGFPASLKPAAGSVLFSSYREKVQNEAAGYISRPKGAEGSNLPPLRDLVATVGNPAKGPQVYQAYCQSCHVINGQGIDFGPDLSEIGDKFSKEGLYRTIIYPSEGINTNFEAYQLQLKGGGGTAGILLSETETEVTLKLVGGQVETYPKSEIEEMKAMSQSLMPPLAGAMSQEELVDLVAYLAELKREAVQ